MTFLCDRLRRADRGHAAGRRRLRLADAGSSTGSRASSTGAVVGARRRSTSPRRRSASATRSPSSPASSASSSAGSSAGCKRRDRLRPGRHGLVVHPRPVGADLRLHPQHRVLPAARGARRVRRRPVPSSRRRTASFSVSIVTIVMPSGARRARAWPATPGSRSGASTSASIGLAIMFVLMLVSSRPTSRPPSTGEGQSLFGVSAPTQATIDNAVGQRRLRARRLARSTSALSMSDTLAAAMIPFMLFWILYPNWGSTLYGEVRGSGDFRKVLRGHARRHLGHDRPRHRVRAARRRRRSAGTSSTPRTRTSSTTSTATRRRRRRCRSGATRRCSRRTSSTTHIFQIGMVVLFGVVVPGLGGDAVPVVDADDLRRGVRPGPARPRRPGVRAPGGA